MQADSDTHGNKKIKNIQDGLCKKKNNLKRSWIIEPCHGNSIHKRFIMHFFWFNGPCFSIELPI
jgi:hypothetical protein